MSNDNDKVNGHAVEHDQPQNPNDWVHSQMIMAMRDVERRFQGAGISIFVIAPGAALGSPQFNYISTADPADQMAVMKSWMIERRND